MDNRFDATGRRKNAIACVMVKPGKGERVVNGLQMKDYLKSDMLVRSVEEPLDNLNVAGSYDMVARVRGGGLSGQADALKLGVARAVAQVSEEYRKQLRRNGYLTRDSRAVERKKYGQAGARRRFQFSKR